MSVDELKAAAAKLSPDERFELVDWIEQNEDIRQLRRAALIREVWVGLDQLDRGEYIECKDGAELKSFFEGVKARGRESFAAHNKPAA